MLFKLRYFWIEINDQVEQLPRNPSLRVTMLAAKISDLISKSIFPHHEGRQPWLQIRPQDIARSHLSTTDKRQIEQWPVEERTLGTVTPALNIVCQCYRYCILNCGNPPTIDESLKTICDYLADYNEWSITLHNLLSS